MKDIAANMIGFFIGRQIHKYRPCKLDKCPNKLLHSYESIAVVVTIISILKIKPFISEESDH